MKRTTTIAAGTLLAGAIVAIPGLAFGHTAKPDADCETGVTLTATRYDAQARNYWTITVNAETFSGQFGSSTVQTIPVPQGGVTSAWTMRVDAPGTQYDFSFSGTVGPCGEAPPPPPPPVTPPPPYNPPEVIQARTHVKVVDKCNCYRDSVKMIGGPHVTIKTKHPSKLRWVFKVAADEGYVLPGRINGNSGWAPVQVYEVKTTNKPCPCKDRGDCHQLYPGYTPPSEPCRGNNCE